jgi:hypothetical protein
MTRYFRHDKGHYYALLENLGIAAMGQKFHCEHAPARVPVVSARDTIKAPNAALANFHHHLPYQPGLESPVLPTASALARH